MVPATLPPTETTTPTVKRIAPVGPISTSATSISARSESASPGRAATLMAWMATYRTVTVTSAENSASGIARPGFFTSPAGTSADSQPTKA